MKEVQQAIASFERTIVGGDSPFDRWHYGGDQKAVNDQVKRGFNVFLTKGRCVSCHAIEQDYATVHRQPLPQHRRRHQSHSERSAAASRRRS